MTRSRIIPLFPHFSRRFFVYEQPNSAGLCRIRTCLKFALRIMDFPDRPTAALIEHVSKRNREWIALTLLSISVLSGLTWPVVFFLDHRAQQRVAERQSQFIEQQRKLLEQQGEFVQHRMQREEEWAKRQKEIWDKLYAIATATPTPQSAEELAQRQARADEANRLYESIRNSGIPEDIARPRSPDLVPDAP
jgi:hypothetical protein